jgi:hypothetical protein
MLLSEICGLVSVGAPSLTRGRVCNLQYNHSMVRVAQNPKPYFTVSSETPPTWRARSPYIYIRQEEALGFLYLASCDSQGCGGGILTLHQPGRPGPLYIHPSWTRWSSRKSKLRYDRLPVNQYVLVSSPRCRQKCSVPSSFCSRFPRQDGCTDTQVSRLQAVTSSVQTWPPSPSWVPRDERGSCLGAYGLSTPWQPLRSDRTPVCRQSVANLLRKKSLTVSTRHRAPIFMARCTFPKEKIILTGFKCGIRAKRSV